VTDVFADVLDANEAFAREHANRALDARPAKRLAVVTCMDVRLDPLPILGLRPGDANVIRNAGGRVTDDVVRSLALAARALGVDRVVVLAHTDCRAVGESERAETLRADVERLHNEPDLGEPEIAGFVYDVETARVSRFC
jgi:carbonic anhydrase